MRILIGAPAKRPLSPNEKRVYDLLKQGLDPKEIARKLHMPYGTEFMCNVHDVTCDTVRHLITSIREKGYTINEEDKPMQNYTDNQKKDVLKFYLDGLTQSEIAERCGVNVKTVSKWICDYKKENEPAQAATCTDSGVENLDSISTPIIKEKTEVVKHIFSEAALNAVYAQIVAKQKEMLAISDRTDKLNSIIDRINNQIDILLDEGAYMQAELDRLWQDYNVISGGAGNDMHV